jgi:hypothetical protein
MATLTALPTSPRTTVFRVIDTILRNDKVLSSVIRPTSFRSWKGNSHDTMEFSHSMAPAIRLTPMNGPETWKFPEAFTGWLFIKCEMLLAGTDADDELNLWYAIEKALYPTGNTLANVQTLQQAGAYSGLVEFSQPSFDPSPQDRYFAAVGEMKIEVRIQLTG